MNPTPRLLIKLRAQAGAKALAATANLQPLSTGIVSVMWRGWSAWRLVSLRKWLAVKSRSLHLDSAKTVSICHFQNDEPAGGGDLGAVLTELLPGSVCSRVGIGGRVVAMELQPRFLMDLNASNLEVWTATVLSRLFGARHAVNNGHRSLYIDIAEALEVAGSRLLPCPQMSSGVLISDVSALS